MKSSATLNFAGADAEPQISTRLCHEICGSASSAAQITVTRAGGLGNSISHTYKCFCPKGTIIPHVLTPHRPAIIAAECHHCPYRVMWL